MVSPLTGYTVNHVTTFNLQELKAMAPSAARAESINAYIAAGEAKIREARRLRDEDLRVLAAAHGPSKASRMVGVSLSTVKLAVGRK
jgi:hypothetical protein